MLLWIFSVLIIIQFIARSNVDAAPGEATNELNNQIVSYINATCEADPLINCPGSYHSAYSFSLLYVPVNTGLAEVTINDVANVAGQTNGLVSFSLAPLTNAPGYVCGNPFDIVLNPTSGSRVSITNNPLPGSNVRQIVNYNVGTVYNVYCVAVYTNDSKPYPNRENVRFRLTTNYSSRLGVFSGPQTSIGTGYFGGNSRSYSNSPTAPNWWGQTVAFSHPCTDAGLDTSGTGAMTLYDLDTYQLPSAFMRIYVDKTLKPGIASAPDGGVAGQTYRVALTGDVTHVGGNVYWINYGGTGENWSINIENEQWQSRYIYSVHIDQIGSANKIRIRLPYDQINSVITCKQNTPPTVTGVSADCNTYSFTVNDPDGDRVSLSLLVDDAAVSGATFNLTGRTANNSVYSFPTDSWRDFGVHKFEVRVNDGSGAIDFAERNVGPCLRVACSLGAVGDVEVNRQFSVSPTFRVQNRSNGASSSIGSRGNEVAINSINVTAGGVTRGATVTGTVPSGGNNTINRGESTITSQASGFVASTEPGTITITASMSTNDGDANASCGAGIETEISALPYMQSFRGDVVAGYGWKATDISVPCTNDADVLGFVDNGVNPDGSENTGSVVGSGTQMAVFARGAVEGFRSAITETNKNTRPWERIFANAGITVATNGINSDNRLGGNFEANLCAENWFADMERSTPSGSISGNQNITSLPEGTSYYNVGGSGTVTLYSSGPVTGYRRIFINGNVRLGRNNPTEKEIVYSTTGWNSVNDIPMLQVIVTGNIWIDDSIEKIDGIIVASDTIYTCAATNLTSFPTGYAANNPNAGAQSNYLKNNDNSNCYTNPLTVNGALLANKIEFWRTGGSISNASPNQDFNAPATIAERFRLPPEVFVAPRQGETSLNGDDGEKYFDSLISLPPVF